jgi:hypothetical protein
MAASSPLLRVAEHSVAAAQHPTGSTTAFAYGPEGGVISTGNGSIHAVTSTGVAITGEVSSSRGGLGIAHVSALPLRALVATRATSIGKRTPKYILGPPLGYEGGRIRAARMPSVRVNGSQLLRVTGRLPTMFLGAPVVTKHGRLIGSVASVGARSWEFAPLGLIEELTAVHQGTSLPVIPIVIGGLILFLGGMAFAVLRAKSRRDRELDLRLRQSRARGAEPRADGPLVRLRTPGEYGEPEQDTEEHFDVIVKPRVEDS